MTYDDKVSWEEQKQYTYENTAEARRVTTVDSSGTEIPVADVIYTDGAGTPVKGIAVMGTDGTNPQILSCNSDGELKVNLETSDIEIGAVEIKDATTDTRQKVKTDGTDNAAVVYQNIQPLPTGAATSTIQTDGSQKTQLVDSAGNVISSTLDTVDGQYHLAVSAIQDVKADTNNSSTTNLDAGNSYTFTGTATSTLGVVGLQWSLKTDQNATVYIDQSDDGTNWDICDTYNYKTSGGGDGETVQALKSYWRLRVVLTGTTDTTYFRLSGVLCPIAEPLPRALTPTGRLKVSNEDINVEIPRGHIVGHNSVNKFGANSSIAAGATEEIWDGNRAYIWPTTASITHIRSAVDSAITRGVVCEVQGLDTNYALVVQNVTTDPTNSTTEVALGTALRRVFRIKILDDTSMDQDIWLGPDPASAANASAIVQAGNNQTLMAIYTVPAGKTAYMTQWKATVNPATNLDPTSMPIRMWARDNANGYAPQLKDIHGLITGTLNVPYLPYNKFTEKTDIYFTASPVGKAADVSLGFDLILVDNE